MTLPLACEALACRIGDTMILRDLDLHVPGGTLTTVVGPSGAGKTTLLRAIAGLAPVTAGVVRLGEFDLSTRPVHRRRLAVVFQEPRLFPGMSMRDNVAFALRMAGVPKRERRTRADDLLEEVGLAGTGRRSVDGLSGGEAQRVALARALAGDPALLLLDEPLSSVDPARREDLRGLIARVQRDRAVTALYVTHDRGEAAALGDHVALLLEGRVIQHATPRAVFERPAAPVVARFFGASLLSGPVVDGRLRHGGVDLPVPGPDRTATVSLRPEHLQHRAGVDPTAVGTLSGTVEASEYQGGHHRLTVDVGIGTVLADLALAAAPRPGDRVTLTVDADHVWALPHPPAQSGTSDRLETP